jgi:probable HAF family extracellular repeat protein
VLPRKGTVNDHGTVVGYSYTGDGQFVAVRWGSDGSITKLGALPGYPDSDAGAINCGGTIAGEVTSSDGQTATAVLWGSDGPVTNLGGLPGQTYAGAAGLDDEGTVVGWSQTSAGQVHAVEWAPVY